MFLKTEMNFKNFLAGVTLFLVLIGETILGICCFYVFQEISRNNKEMENNLSEMKAFRDIKVLFVGDIMLDRGVEFLTDKYGVYYPFEKISQFLNKADIVIGVLEGPIMENPPYFSDESMRFAFSADTLKALAWANFSVLSLANNHTLNMGYSGLEETKAYLRTAGIGFVGDPAGCNRETTYEIGDLILLSFNKTFPFNCSDEEIVEVIKEIKQENTNKILAVIFHWGEEYQKEPSTNQQDLAHSAVDAGADVIIGSHPHIVQKTEEYKGKMIFYSLGNFIFDQYFSEETQKGLIVELKIRSGKPGYVYKLFPIESRLSQPILIE